MEIINFKELPILSWLGIMSVLSDAESKTSKLNEAITQAISMMERANVTLNDFCSFIEHLSEVEHRTKMSVKQILENRKFRQLGNFFIRSPTTIISLDPSDYNMSPLTFSILPRKLQLSFFARDGCFALDYVFFAISLSLRDYINLLPPATLRTIVLERLTILNDHCLIEVAELDVFVYIYKMFKSFNINCDILLECAATVQYEPIQKKIYDAYYISEELKNHPIDLQNVYRALDQNGASSKKRRTME